MVVTVVCLMPRKAGITNINGLKKNLFFVIIVLKQY